MKVVLLLCVVVAAVSAVPVPMAGTNEAGGVDWAVLVAGSNSEWWCCCSC